MSSCVSGPSTLPLLLTPAPFHGRTAFIPIPSHPFFPLLPTFSLHVEYIVFQSVFLFSFQWFPPSHPILLLTSSFRIYFFFTPFNFFTSIAHLPFSTSFNIFPSSTGSPIPFFPYYSSISSLPPAIPSFSSSPCLPTRKSFRCTLFYQLRFSSATLSQLFSTSNLGIFLPSLHFNPTLAQENTILISLHFLPLLFDAHIFNFLFLHVPSMPRLPSPTLTCPLNCLFSAVLSLPLST